MREREGCGTQVVLGVAGVWAALVMVVGQSGAWLDAQIAMLTGGERALWVGPVIALFVALLAAAPSAALLAALDGPGARAVLRTWLLACLLAALAAPLRALDPSASQAASLGLAALCLAVSAVAARVLRPAGEAPATGGPRLAGVALAGSLGMVASLPWLRLGALGSPLDTALAVLAGASMALAMALILHGALLQPLAGLAWLPVPAGAAAAVALLIAGAGLGMGGDQLLLLLVLPALGFALPALHRVGGLWSAVALLAPAAAAVLALVDPDEFTLLLVPGDVPQYAMQAAGQSLLLGLALGGLLAAAERRVRAAPLVSAGALALSLAGAGAAYAAGQPGFYGDRLFVVLRDQADPAALAQGAAPSQRAAAVYGGLTQHAERTQAALLADLGRRGVAYTPYYLVNAVEVHADDPWLRAELAARPDVDRVLGSPLLRPLPAPPVPETGESDPPDGPTWNVTVIGAPRVWQELGVTGAGVVVGQIDSGVDGEHPALRDGYRGRGGQDDYSWLDPWSGAPGPVDLGGHGTHVIGTVLGRDGAGVAPGAEWIGCVALERNLGAPPRYLECLQFMLAPFPQRGDPLRDGDPARAAQVLSNSWGCPPEEGCDAESLRPAVDALRAAGIFVVAAAGNEGPGCSSASAPIGIYDAVFTVGAVDDSGAPASFSSRGPVTADGSGRAKPDIAAPGVDILAAWPGGGYSTIEGTSMASPHVAGVVALMWSASPALAGDIERTEAILRETAAPLDVPGPTCGGAGNVVGAGLVDAYAAVRAAQAVR